LYRMGSTPPPREKHAMSLQGFSGAAGIKYGLNLRGVKKPAPARGVFAASADDGDEEAEEDRAETDAARANIQIARQQAQQRESQKARVKRCQAQKGTLTCERGCPAGARAVRECAR
jgi:hypothetical protein